MRLFLLPISTRRSLIYCQQINKQLNIEKQSYVDRIISQPSRTWLSWEKAEKGWKKAVTSYGKKLFKRLPYEEWGLKSIPPLSATQKLGGDQKALVEYPQSVIADASMKDAVKSFAAEERQKFHMKWLLASFLGMPIVAPFSAVPILPNLPFIYVCFRAWSHWRARSGSQHLNFLLKNQLIQPSPSKILDDIYTLQKLIRSLETLKSDFKTIQSPSKSEIISSESLETPSEIEPSESPESPHETMLLSPSSGRLIADCLDLPEIEEEVERAIHQVEAALRVKREVEWKREGAHISRAR